MFALPQARLQACQHTLGREYLYQLEDDADVMDALELIREEWEASMVTDDEEAPAAGQRTKL